MAGISISIDLVQDEARASLRALLDRMDNRLPFFNAVGERMLASTKDRFQTETAPDGTPWAPLSRSRIKQREAAKLTPIRILRARGYLAGSINYQATADEVAIGSPVESAAAHQLGAAIQQSARPAKIYRKRGADGSVGRRFVRKSEADVVTDVTMPARTINLPARPFLGLTAADEIGILEDAEDWLLGQ